MSEQHPDPGKWWRHRRRGYYIGIWWAVLQTPGWIALELANAGTVGALTAVVGWSYGIAGGLIGAYFCNTTFETVVTKGAR